MAKAGGPNAQMYLGRSTEYTLTAIEEIRNLSKGVGTDIIKSLGLCMALENLSHDMTEVSTLKITVLTKGFQEPAFNDVFKQNLFRIVQEQLNNIMKHARAQKVRISLSQNKKAVVLMVTDNGVGFNTDSLPKGMGQANIRSRAAACKGVLKMISSPGKGCLLTVTFPMTTLITEAVT